jgi:hypothetical protein
LVKLDINYGTHLKEQYIMPMTPSWMNPLQQITQNTNYTGGAVPTVASQGGPVVRQQGRGLGGGINAANRAASFAEHQNDPLRPLYGGHGGPGSGLFGTNDQNVSQKGFYNNYDNGQPVTPFQSGFKPGEIGTLADPTTGATDTRHMQGAGELGAGRFLGSNGRYINDSTGNYSSGGSWGSPAQAAQNMDAQRAAAWKAYYQRQGQQQPTGYTYTSPSTVPPNSGTNNPVSGTMLGGTGRGSGGSLSISGNPQYNAGGFINQNNWRNPSWGNSG